MTGKIPPRQQPKRTPNINTSRALGSKSPLLNADIQTFLSMCVSSWEDVYNDEERKDIIQSLPQSRQTLERGASEGLKFPLTAEFIATDEYVKRAIARFQRDVAEGYYEKSWQDRAKRASQERNDGKFDDYLRESLEEMFCEENDVLVEEDVETSDEEYGRGKRKKSLQAVKYESQERQPEPQPPDTKSTERYGNGSNSGLNGADAQRGDGESVLASGSATILREHP